jgi:hypothetical protein
MIVLGQRDGFPIAQALHAEAMLVGPGGSVACTERFAERRTCGARIDRPRQRTDASKGLPGRNTEATLASSFAAKRIPR